MAVVASQTAGIRTTEELVPEMALRYAWCAWLTMLSVPLVMFLYVCWNLMDEQVAKRNLPAANAWFVACVAYMITVVPAAIFWRSWHFKSYWSGECVAPKSYLIGMIGVWVTIEIGGIASLIACLATNSLLPNLLPALVAFMLFLPLWPSGRAMICSHRGNSDDPETYEEPR
jgi:hypothetical protein